MLDEYDGCFSGSELKQIRIRIDEMRRSGNGGGRTPDEPIAVVE
jgi:hypothetical protein